VELHIHFRAAIAAALTTVAATAQATVTTQPPSGFTITQERQVQAQPAALLPALGAVGTWWNDRHTFSGSAANLSMDLRAGGCFCERWGDNSVQHLQVLTARPGAVRLIGAMGPLQGLAVNGVMTIELRPSDGKNLLTVTYRIGGADAATLQQWPDKVDAMISETTDRLAHQLDLHTH
jgi:hypothetical protein